MSDFPHPSASDNHVGVPPADRRLIFINRFFHPGPSATSQILSDLVFALADQNFDIHVIAGRRRRAGATAAPAATENLCGVFIHRIAMPDLARLGLLGRAIEYAAFSVGAVAALRRHVREGDIVVAKTDPPLIAVLAGVVARRQGAKLVNWLQDIYPEVATRLDVPLVKGPVSAVLQKLRDAALQNAAVNVAIGERIAEFVAARGVAAQKIRVIPNWANDEAIAPVPPAQNPLRSRFGLEGAFIIGYSGNLGRAHEFETLLGAADLLRREKGLVFLFIGGGVYVEALRKRVCARGLDDAFMFLPAQPRGGLSNSLSLPDVHWLSLRPDLEGLIVPSKFYGIAAAGRPVIAITAKDGEIARIVETSNCGIVVEPGRSSELAAGIIRLRADRRLCDAMGANARALIEARFSRRRALEAWRQLFNNL
ncbi:MAG: glycosyltransferase family 4 protein [Methylocystis sp.]|nr:glycosyltransferase family 4 protein [Methylocystis sp.]